MKKRERQLEPLTMAPGPRKGGLRTQRLPPEHPDPRLRAGATSTEYGRVGKHFAEQMAELRAGPPLLTLTEFLCIHA